MTPFKSIGGYFELELPNHGAFPHADAALLSTGRACFEYMVTARKPTRVYLPKFTCDVMLEPLKKLGVPYAWYSIDKQLELAEKINLKEDELLVYTNYFGVKDKYATQLAAYYSHKLILDCSQAFYFEPIKNSHTFYSPRKFFGVPDGGCLYTDKYIDAQLEQDISVDRVSHLLMRLDVGAEYGYQQFLSNDKCLEDQPIKRMSNLTKRILHSINYEEAMQRRLANFQVLSRHLSGLNKAVFLDAGFTAPMCYPLLLSGGKGEILRKYLIQNKIYVPTYWPNVYEWCSKEEIEHYMATNIVSLPIDQRYNESDMNFIAEKVTEFLKP